MDGKFHFCLPLVITSKSEPNVFFHTPEVMGVVDNGETQERMSPSRSLSGLGA